MLRRMLILRILYGETPIIIFKIILVTHEEYANVLVTLLLL